MTSSGSPFAVNAVLKLPVAESRPRNACVGTRSDKSDERIIKQLIVGNKQENTASETVEKRRGPQPRCSDRHSEALLSYTYRIKNSMIPSIRKKTAKLEETNNYDYKLTTCL